LVKKRQAGQLDDFVRVATLKCVSGETVMASLRPSSCAAAKGRAR